MKTILKTLLLAAILLSTNLVRAQNPQIYTIFDNKGKEVTYTHFITNLSSADLVLFGEMHNCPLTHWLEKKVSQSLYQVHKDKFILGAEMFETDNQIILDEFLSGLISEERFEAEIRLWPNYTTDYMPLIDFAKENKIPFFATNIPRRYANSISSSGMEILEKLDKQSLKYIAPLPIPYESDSTQVAFFNMMGSMGHSKRNPEFMAQAQAIKDATMAWFIVQNTKEKHFLHFNGNYHSDSNNGIPQYLKKYSPNLKVVTISSTRQEQINTLDEVNYERADFIIVVREDFPFSY